MAKVIQKADFDLVVLLGRNYANVIEKDLLGIGFDKQKIINAGDINVVIKKEIILKIEQMLADTNITALFEGYQSRKFLDMEFSSKKVDTDVQKDSGDYTDKADSEKIVADDY